MVELPEAYVLSAQINQTLSGKPIASAAANTHPHAFAWYTGDPAEYNDRLAGKKITASAPGTDYTCGGNIEILCDDMLIVLNTPAKYHAPGEKLPKSHQLLLKFQDESHMSCTVQMWGAMLCFPVGSSEAPNEKDDRPTPYDDAFDETYFDGLWRNVKPTMSTKAFLATEQRIPGFGNGVLHDVLWHAGIHPKRKLSSFTDADKAKLYQYLKTTLLAMRDQGGRDTEKDLYGCKGGYKTILSSNTLKHPCQTCGSALVREAYLGGNIYYCPVCQPL